MALLVSSSPVPQHHVQHQRRPQSPLSFLEDFFQKTLGFFTNSTFGSAPPRRESSFSYDGNHLPTDDQILNGLIAMQNYRKGLNSATANQ